MSLTEQLVSSEKSFPSFRASCLRETDKQIRVSFLVFKNSGEHPCQVYLQEELMEVCMDLFLRINNTRQIQHTKPSMNLMVPHLVFRGMEKGRLCRTACLKRGLLLWIIRWRLTD